MSDDRPQVFNQGGSRRRARRRSGCLPILVVLLIVGIGGYYFVRSIDLENPFASDPDDFTGAGNGTFTVFTVSSGDTIAVMGRNLEELGVVASVDAYLDAASANPESSSIREGVYRLQEGTQASTVVDLLVAGTTRGTSFTFTSGKTVEEVLALLADQSDVPRADLDKAAARPGALGLPKSARGSLEGYLSAGSYTFFPEDDASTILSAMVARTVESLAAADFAAAARRLGYDEHDLLTIASLIETEGSLLDEKGKAKIARVIYNRLADPTAETIGRLQLDATVNYALGEKVARPTQAQIDSVADNPYNTYTNAGLPPGPIATVSQASLTAATQPAKGDWLYYVTVNLDTGLTKFTVSYDDFLTLKNNELDAFCDQSDKC